MEASGEICSTMPLCECRYRVIIVILVTIVISHSRNPGVQCSISQIEKKKFTYFFAAKRYCPKRLPVYTLSLIKFSFAG